jgi:CBS-domain-containing membrane protein
MEDEDVEEAADTMSNLRIRRLPIVDDDKRLVGVLSLGDIAFKHKASTAGTTLVHVCDPHGHVR